MESTNNNNNSNQMFLCEFKELRKELSAVKKRIVQLEESHEKQQEKIHILEKENHALKTQLNINSNKEVGSTLKRKRTDQEKEKETETDSKPVSTSVSTSVSAGKKKTKTNNDDKDDDEVLVIPQRDNGDSFDSLSDDLLHKIVEFDGNCYSKFGSINKRCKNIYDVKEYKLKKQTCVFGYGTVDMMLERFLQIRREDELGFSAYVKIVVAVIKYNRLDAVDWIIQLGHIPLLKWLCFRAACYGKINVLTKVFRKCNLTILDEVLNHGELLCGYAAGHGHLETLKWLRRYGAEWNANSFLLASTHGHDEIVQYLRAEGCPEQDEDL